MKVALLSLLALLTSCTMSIKGVCESGPNKGQIITAKAGYNGLGSGKITAVAPWGERAEGRYLTSIASASTGAWGMESRRTASGVSAEGDDVAIHADSQAQVGTAVLIGDQGTSFNVVYWASIWSPTHGQGRIKDSRGNRYRMVW